MEKLRRIYEEVKLKRSAAIINEKDSCGVIYKGLKFCLEDDRVFILSTATNIYTEIGKDIYEEFYNNGLDAGVKKFRDQRFSRALSRISTDSPFYLEIYKLWKQQ